MRQQDKDIAVLWQDGCLSVQSSILKLSSGPFPMTEVITEAESTPISADTLRGRTADGRCVSVHDFFVSKTERHNSIRTFDLANMTPVEDGETFNSTMSTIQITDAFIGDAFIEENNPLIDKVKYQSEDLFYLGELSPFHKDDCFSFQLFKNDYVELSYWKGCSFIDGRLHKSKDYSSGIDFSFSEPVRLLDAYEFWVFPIINLLTIVCGGEIIPDRIEYQSKELGAVFERLVGDVWKRNPKNQPTLSSSFLGFEDDAGVFQKAISSWMERPNTLRGTAGLFSIARYRENQAEICFSFAMRMAEAAYADKLIEEKCETDVIPSQKDGAFDLEKPELKPIRALVKKLSNSNAISFKQKVEELAKHYDDLFIANEQSIDWVACSKECKNLRNAVSHGTLVGGTPHKEHDKMVALIKMGELLYELSVLDLFPLSNEEMVFARQLLFARSQLSVSVDKFWSASQ